MRATVATTTRILQDRIEITAEGCVSTRPRFTYRQRIAVDGRACPEFSFHHPVPEYYTWDHSRNEEKYQEITVETVLSRPFKEFPEKIEIYVKQWTKKGHIWREMEVNGESATQEIWYEERWDHGTLYKDLWIQWNRGEAKEEVHVQEADGLRERHFFKVAKRVMGPPGFFWFKAATGSLSDHKTAVAWRFALAPEHFKLRENIDLVGQDFGYEKWPSNLWLKMAYDRKAGVFWQSKEVVENKESLTEIRAEQKVEEKKLKI